MNEMIKADLDKMRDIAYKAGHAFGRLTACEDILRIIKADIGKPCGMTINKILKVCSDEAK